MTVAHTDGPKSGRNGRTSVVTSAMERIPRLAKGESSRKDTERGKLRQTWEMDNFSCSHHCTSYGDCGQGALVLVALARPAKRSRCNANAKRGT